MSTTPNKNLNPMIEDTDNANKDEPTTNKCSDDESKYTIVKSPKASKLITKKTTPSEKKAIPNKNIENKSQISDEKVEIIDKQQIPTPTKKVFIEAPVPTTNAWKGKDSVECSKPSPKSKQTNITTGYTLLIVKRL